MIKNANLLIKWQSTYNMALHNFFSLLRKKRDFLAIKNELKKSSKVFCIHIYTYGRFFLKPATPLCPKMVDT